MDPNTQQIVHLILTNNLLRLLYYQNLSLL
nr:MAG TPA: hypothetical protein [Caudoviricetes sp.]